MTTSVYRTLVVQAIIMVYTPTMYSQSIMHIRAKVTCMLQYKLQTTMVWSTIVTVIYLDRLFDMSAL